VHYHSTFTAPELSFQSLVRLESLPASRTRHTGTSGLTPRQTDNRQAYPSRLVFDLSLSLSETPSVHSTAISSTLTVTLPVEGSDALDILKNYRCSPLDCYCNNRLRRGVEQMSNPSGSPPSIPGRYRCSYPIIVPCERGDYTHRIVGYSYTLREVIVTCLLVVSNREISKVTVHTDRGVAL